jgi:murein DD-endopeptidase MepM/ murein hydrolase activator NlpD
MRHSLKTLVLAILVGSLVATCWADPLDNPVTEETQKTQHFVKYTYKNSAAVPVTVKVNASGSNLKTSQRMPYIFVIPPRGTKEAFQTSAKDPRSYYSAPDVSLDHKIGDYRLGASNMKLDLPWESGKSATVASLQKNVLTFQLDEGQKVVSGRQGLVVATGKSSVMVAHNDGSLTIYSDLDSVKAKLEQQVRSGQELGTAGEDPVTFKVAVPTQGMDYRALPAKFTVNGSKTTLSAGEKYTK